MSTTKQHTCADCKKPSPVINSEFTLISGSWKFTRRMGEDKKPILEWHCPECWAAARKSQSTG